MMWMWMKLCIVYVECIVYILCMLNVNEIIIVQVESEWLLNPGMLQDAAEK